MDELIGCYVRWNKPDIEGQMLLGPGYFIITYYAPGTITGAAVMPRINQNFFSHSTPEQEVPRGILGVLESSGCLLIR